jgi:hypothetical protein
MPLTLTDLTRLCGDLLRRPGGARNPQPEPRTSPRDRRAGSFHPQQTGLHTRPIEQLLFEDAAARGPEYFNAFLDRAIGNPGRATEARLRAVIRATVLGKPLFEMPQPVALLPGDYARHLQADEPWWQKLIEQTSEDG